MGRQPIPFEERFWPRVDYQPDGCWKWLGPLDPKTGYGKVSYEGRESTGVHRASYMHFVGPIPAGLTIDHLCKNRWCVNPAHLEPCTRGENSLRGDGPAALNKRKTHCKRGHLLSGDNVYVRKGGAAAGSRICVTCRDAREAKMRDARDCAVCGTTFECYRHHPTQTCSPKCAATLQWQTRKAA